MTQWFQFDWHGYHRGSLQFTIFYSEKGITYDSTSHLHLHYLQTENARARGEEWVPEHRVLADATLYKSSLYRVVCAIFRDDPFVRATYDSCLPSIEKEGIIDYAFRDFEYKGGHAYMDAIWSLSFQQKVAYDALQ
jgi:hypothetical protein